MPYLVEVSDEFSSAHQLRGYRGKCENLHGHNWKVTAVFGARDLGPVGMAIDFGDCRKILREVLSSLDHRFLNDLPPFAERNPTSEIVAGHIFGEISARLDHPGVKLVSVSVWESDRARATYFEGDLPVRA